MPSVTVYQTIEACAEHAPRACAVLSPGQAPLTYEHLRLHLVEIASRLNSLGIGRNDRVAIVLPNGPEMAVAFLSVASCATSAPLNPAYRATEFDFYLNDLKAKALLVLAGSDSPARDAARERRIPIMELSPLDSGPAGTFRISGDPQPLAAQKGFAQPDDVALILHTSGTTSRPKIVPLTHLNICTSARNIVSTLRLTEADRCLNVMPLFHIHGLIGALLSSMTAGGNVVCTAGFNESKFFGWMKERVPTWYTAVPTMHQAILARADENADVIANCPLRLIRSSSSSLPPQVMEKLESVFNAPVIESYGMTEAAHQMASNPLPPRQRKPGSVGVSAGPEVAIMDEVGNFLPAGSKGEIVIKGANVTAAYENNPDANKNSFTNGWFRTGDQGFMDDEGYLFISGRLKEIVNRGGEKVMPREVDEILLDHPAVAQAVAFAVPHERLGEDLAAAVVLRKDAVATEKEIREFAFSRLAAFKVPSQILIVDEIPKGPTGKLQRIGLAEKLAERLKPPFVAPRDEIEEKLAAIFEKVLRVEKAGILDNFFMLGGDSLMAMRASGFIRESLGGDFPLSTLFETPTIEQLAGRFSKKA
jgi:oxalate---CoA ligase